MPQWIDPKISFGNFLTIGGLIAAWLFGYASLQGRVQTAELNVNELKVQYERRETALQREQNIINRMDDLRSRMERMEKKLDLIR